MIADSHIRIPFDVVDVRILCHQVVHYLEHIVLNLRIGKVQHQLSASPSVNRLTLRSLQDPVRMFLVEFAKGVGHLRLNPDSEFYSLVGSHLHK